MTTKQASKNMAETLRAMTISYENARRGAVAAAVAFGLFAQTYQAEAKPQRPCHKKTTKKTTKRDKVTTWREPVTIVKPGKRAR